MACALGSAAAQAGDGYEIEDLGQLNCVQADKKLTEGIAAGSVEAAYTAAQMVIRRVCFKRDVAVYVGFLRTASERGHKLATQDLGYAHALGEGVSQDYALAGELLRRSGELRYQDMDHYTLGYAWSLSRLVRRYAKTSVPAWLNREHPLRVTLLIDLARLPPTGTVVPVGDVSADVAEESKALVVNVKDDLDDAIVKAMKKLAPPRANLLGNQKATVTWQLTILRSADTRKGGKVEIDAFLPR